jgi:hypothetical protein
MKYLKSTEGRAYVRNVTAKPKPPSDRPRPTFPLPGLNSNPLFSPSSLGVSSFDRRLCVPSALFVFSILLLPQPFPLPAPS